MQLELSLQGGAIYQEPRGYKVTVMHLWPAVFDCARCGGSFRYGYGKGRYVDDCGEPTDSNTGCGVTYCLPCHAITYGSRRRTDPLYRGDR